MNTCTEQRDDGWAVWLTGLPASGKSTIAAALAGRLRQFGEPLEVLESDELRRRLTPDPTYAAAERDLFYAAMAHSGALLARHGVGVIFDATAHRRAYREAARRQINRFIEVWVRCPVDLCRRRDRKGIYQAADRDPANRVPGAGEVYEPNVAAEVVVDADREPIDRAAERILTELRDRGWLRSPRSRQGASRGRGTVSGRSVGR